MDHNFNVTEEERTQILRKKLENIVQDLLRDTEASQGTD